MAGPKAIAAVGRSIVALLDRRFGEDIPGAQRPTAMLIGTPDFAGANVPGTTIPFPAVTVYIYRVTVDPDTRAACAQATALDGRPRIPLCVHFLVTAWDANADFELQWLGHAIEILERDASLAGPMLDMLGGWGAAESVQIVAEDVSLESMSEAFTALTADFRLSMPYVARVVRIMSKPEAVTGRVATVIADFGRVLVTS